MKQSTIAGLIQTRIVLPLCCLWMLGSVALSVANRDWSWMERGGTMITIFGGFLAARRFMRTSSRDIYMGDHIICGGSAKDPFEGFERTESYADIRAARWSVLVIGLGSVLSAYGSPLMTLISPFAPPNSPHQSR